LSADQDSSGPRRSTQVLTWLWYAASLTYCGVRVYLADRYLRDHGLNVAVFAAIEFAATLPYAIGSARAVGAIVRHDTRRALLWALVASAGFVAPDVYLLATTDEPPRWLELVIGVWLVVGLAFALRRGVQATRAATAARRADG
jgi:hypothetical protein